ncbi:hypothetical protein CkaCkLH20_09167 [Colletotrichum karsti]|uniref:C2H2-type domain-containing protein n=1 Tax=Colletotrichum karsti TaxID=1095194 RepID=A0A9P6HZK8_9PEZI|nr:uncharacterized protein CkaCkLH20_09167 [Colletotrichum karsti]KAF9873354.1 hypothetical protein CkaCkLH20_09167 [Colletotrichum karsti]
MEVADKPTTQDAIFRSLQALAIASGESLNDVFLANEALMMNLRLKSAQMAAAQDPQAMPQSEYAVIYHGYHTQTDSGNGFVRGVPVNHPPGVFTSTRSFLFDLDNGAQNGTIAQMGGIPTPGAPLFGNASVTMPQAHPQNHALENPILGAGNQEIGFMEDLNEASFDNLVIDVANGRPRDENSTGYDFGDQGLENFPVNVADGMANDLANFQPLVNNANAYGAPSPGNFVAEEPVRSDCVEYFQYDGNGEYGWHAGEKTTHDQSNGLRCHLCSKTYKIAGFLSRHLNIVHGQPSSL